MAPLGVSLSLSLTHSSVIKGEKLPTRGIFGPFFFFRNWACHVAPSHVGFGYFGGDEKSKFGFMVGAQA